MVMHDPNAPIITMKKLLEGGVHFGHQTRKWNPKMGKFIYGARNGIYIIDLAKSAQKIQEAYLALKAMFRRKTKLIPCLSDRLAIIFCPMVPNWLLSFLIRKIDIKSLF